jgi:hypothetical protein
MAKCVAHLVHSGMQELIMVRINKHKLQYFRIDNEFPSLRLLHFESTISGFDLVSHLGQVQALRWRGHEHNYPDWIPNIDPTDSHTLCN